MPNPFLYRHYDDNLKDIAVICINRIKSNGYDTFNDLRKQIESCIKKIEKGRDKRCVIQLVANHFNLEKKERKTLENDLVGKKKDE